MSEHDSGRAAIVTGAARGIGVAIAQRLLADGYRVLVVDRDREGLVATAKELATHGEVASLAQDLTEPQAPTTVVREARQRFDRLDVLVNNAGVVPLGPFIEVSDDELSDCLDVNVRSLFLLTQAVVRDMIDHGATHGRVISLGTVNTVVGTLDTSAYSASKGAVSALARQLAVELGPHGITSNEVAPGPVATERVRAALSPEQIEQRRARIPTSTQPEPEDVARAVAFLASVTADAINGQTLLVDGGFAIKGA